MRFKLGNRAVPTTPEREREGERERKRLKIYGSGEGGESKRIVEVKGARRD